MDVLVNNAGLPNIFLPPDRSLTKQGLEMVYGTNFIGHFLLTKLLIGRLMAGDGGRVVNLASVCHQFASKGDGILDQAEGKGPQIAGYNDSKLAMILHARVWFSTPKPCELNHSEMALGSSFTQTFHASEAFPKRYTLIPHPSTLSPKT